METIQSAQATKESDEITGGGLPSSPVRRIVGTLSQTQTVLLTLGPLDSAA